MTLPQTVNKLDELLRSSEIGMYRHYWAARRCRRLERFVSIAQIVINVLLGSTFLYALAGELPSIAKWIGATLALVVAAVSGLESHLGLAGSFEQHHKIANQYRALARTVETVRANYDDKLISLVDVAEQLTNLLAQYDIITRQGEAFITRQSDYRKAVPQQAKRQKRVAQRVAEEIVAPER